MALTIAKVKHNIGLNHRTHIYDVTFDNSYPTGGEAVTAANFGLGTINAIVVQNKGLTSFPSVAKYVTFDEVNSKLLIYTAVGTEATNTSDQSAVKVRLVVHGDRV